MERQYNRDGTKNPKYVDLLEEDKPISGQKYVCVSFVSPEKILKQKNMFFFQEFLKHFDFDKSMKKHVQFINFISYKYNLDMDKVMGDYQEFIKSEKDKLIETTVEDEYKNFLDAHEERLEKDFSEANNFRTSTRGIKIRGSFPTQQEAELRCSMLREVDPNHDVYVGPVGMWMPWEPEAYKTGRVEYLEEELNQLMHEKKKNETKAKHEFEKRVTETKRKAIEENIRKAKETGAKLTQGITKDGQLVSVGEMNTIEKNLLENSVDGETITSADVRKELFDGENVITKETVKNEKHKQLTQNIQLNTIEETNEGEGDSSDKE